MLTPSEIAALFSAIFSNTVSLMTGILGLIMTALGIWKRQNPSGHVFLALGLVALFVSPVVAWRDEHRALNEVRAKASEEIVALKTQIARLENQEAVKARRRAIRERLGAFIARVGALKQQTLALGKSPPQGFPPTDDANKWEARVRQYLLQNLDASYEARFSSPAPVLIVHPGVSPDHDDLWRWLEARTVRLNEFIAELKD